MEISILALALLFAATAALYASVGFGGGSTYIALLALAALDYRALPVIALLCNIIVVTGGTTRFQARGLIDWARIWPILLLTRWADSRRIAATASVFILVNSIAGLAGQLMKSGWSSGGEAVLAYWPLFLAVLLGGQIGSFMASKALPEIWIRRLTALLILYVAARILWF